MYLLKTYFVKKVFLKYDQGFFSVSINILCKQNLKITVWWSLTNWETPHGSQLQDITLEVELKFISSFFQDSYAQQFVNTKNHSYIKHKNLTVLFKMSGFHFNSLNTRCGVYSTWKHFCSKSKTTSALNWKVIRDDEAWRLGFNLEQFTFKG